MDNPIVFLFTAAVVGFIIFYICWAMLYATLRALVQAKKARDEKPGTAKKRVTFVEAK